MYRVLVALAIASCAYAGIVEGVVLEQASGRPLARTTVRLDAVPQAGSAKRPPLTMRTTLAGHFLFLSVTPGTYLVTAIREGYLPVAYGQRLPIGRGTPFQVTADSNFFAELRMRHKSAITGRILDENGVGTPGISVLAYPAQLPLREAGTATSDDRGVFRIHGLDPGKYWVRSAANTFDDASAWLPTFGLQGREVADAKAVLVAADADSSDADISPEPGALFHLGGFVGCDTDGAVIVTLSSETGRRSTQTLCKMPYRFDGLAPGAYEVSASLQDASAAGFVDLFLDQDSDSGNIQVLQLPMVDIEVRRTGSSSPADVGVTLIARRVNLAETEPEREIGGLHTVLAPGYWEMRARVPGGQYVESIVNLRNSYRRPWKAERASDWFEVFIEPRAGARIRITISGQAGKISGGVTAEGKPAPGVPLFLWPVAESARRSLSGTPQTLSDTEGRYRFDGLPPGDYRVLATFDASEIDEDLLNLSQAPVVHADASQSATVDLPVWTAP
jgi:hypothetical protein